MFGIFRRDLDDLGVALGLRIAEDVDRIVVAPMRRAAIRSSASMRLRARAPPVRPPFAIKRIGRQHAGPAGIRHDRQARPFGPRLLGQHLRHVEEVGDACCTRSTPQRRNAASSTSSLPGQRSRYAKPPPCAAASVRPALITMIGLVSETSRAAERNERASPIDSMYMTMLCVRGSLPK